MFRLHKHAKLSVCRAQKQVWMSCCQAIYQQSVQNHYFEPIVQLKNVDFELIRKKKNENTVTITLLLQYRQTDVEFFLVSLVLKSVVSQTKCKLKSIFARHGIPQLVLSDSGTQFASSEFQCFSRDYRFQRVKSSTRYPQSNGEVERTAKTVKSLIKKFSDPHLTLLIYRETLVSLRKSLAELLIGQQLQMTIPLRPSRLKP